MYHGTMFQQTVSFRCVRAAIRRIEERNGVFRSHLLAQLKNERSQPLYVRQAKCLEPLLLD